MASHPYGSLQLWTRQAVEQHGTQLRGQGTPQRLLPCGQSQAAGQAACNEMGPGPHLALISLQSEVLHMLCKLDAQAECTLSVVHTKVSAVQ